MPNFVPSRFCIRTSNCRSYRRCRRKWGYESSMRRNLTHQGSEQNIHFWFGTGIHFAMEDFFGFNRFGDPREAFLGYYDSFKQDELPTFAQEHRALGLSMLTYFLEWYPKHNGLRGVETVWVMPDKTEVPPFTEGAHPLVEEAFMLDLGFHVWVRDDTEDIVAKNDEELIMKYGIALASLEFDKPFIWDGDKKIGVHKEQIYYHGTCDRIVTDPQGNWYILDWKTAKGHDTNKLETDDQITRYLWAMEQWFQRPIKGFIYLQLTKDVVQKPRELKNGELSVDKKQKTTSALLRKELIKRYGTVDAAPAKLIDFLNVLNGQEDTDGDRFIRWDFVERTKAQKESTYKHILAEAAEMISPDLYLYPTPTRDCIWECSFRDACLMEERQEMEQLNEHLNKYYMQRPHKEDEEVDEWRKDIKWPDTPFVLDVDKDFQIEDLEDMVMNIILPDKYNED